MCYAIPYNSETIPIKMASYGLFTGIMGATLAPIAFMGGKERERERGKQESTIHRES